MVANYCCCYRIQGTKFGTLNRKGVLEADPVLFILFKSGVFSEVLQK